MGREIESRQGVGFLFSLKSTRMLPMGREIESRQYTCSVVDVKLKKIIIQEISKVPQNDLLPFFFYFL
jgi:hypothetical protein